jgi:hypothetical protein
MAFVKSDPAMTTPPVAPARSCNLLLVTHRGVGDASDFHRVGEYIARYRPEVRTRVIVDGRYRLKKWLSAYRPTMVFSPVEMKQFQPVRGRVFAGRSLSKTQEYDALVAAGVPVPRSVAMTESNPRPDVSAFGQYVVVKPDRGGRGAHVRIVRSSRARWEPVDSRIAGKSDASLAQEFIYTGPWPVSYRVTTLFGQVIWALKIEASHTRAPLPGPEAFASVPGLSVVSNSKGCVMSPTFDEEVIRFGETAHRAFPSIPLLGVDVVRREPDGKLFVIEVNASGWVWHFSSALGLRAQQEFGFRLEDQFDGIRKAARILADQAVVSAC